MPSSESSSSRKRSRSELVALLLVWFCRVFVGGAFVVAGWAKAIDPWGFLYKITEYLTVWGWEMPREFTLTGAVALACVEFCTGVLVLTGSLKRVGVWCAAAMMLVMLPLTAYIAVANPVADCGCFGDFLILSNPATFVKNIFLSAAVVYLLLKNTSVAGLFAAPVQWLLIAVSCGYPLFLAFTGYQVQPLVDFRPYKVGTPFPGAETSDTSDESDVSDDDDEALPVFLYEKDGVRKEFSLDALPDSTWNYVGELSGSASDNTGDGFGVYDEDGNDVSSMIISEDVPALVLVVSDPEYQFLSRSHYIHELYRYSTAKGVDMIALVGSTGETFDRWVALTSPEFPVYSVEDTSLKQLVRGDAALVYVVEGVIAWKQTLSSMDASLPDSTLDVCEFDTMEAIDNGRFHLLVTGLYLLSVIVIYLLGMSPKILNLFLPRKSVKNP